MYLYHYPDIWYDYATWHAKNGSTNSAIKVFQRALKALPGIVPVILLFFIDQSFLCYSTSYDSSFLLFTDSEMLKYAYAELEESCGHIEVCLVFHELLDYCIGVFGLCLWSLLFFPFF